MNQTVERTSEEPLGLTVHTMPAATRQQRMGRLKMLLVLLVCASPVIASYTAYFLIKPGAGANYGALIEPAREMPDFALTLPDGSTESSGSLRRQWLLLLAGPSACAKECEDRLYMQRQLREMMGRERDRIDRVWLLTDDGAVDAQLMQALQATGGMTIARAADTAVASWLQPEAGKNLQDHLYIIDPMGRWMMREPANADPYKVKKDLERLLRASASWDKAGR